MVNKDAKPLKPLMQNGIICSLYFSLKRGLLPVNITLLTLFSTAAAELQTQRPTERHRVILICVGVAVTVTLLSLAVCKPQLSKSLNIFVGKETTVKWNWGWVPQILKPQGPLKMSLKHPFWMNHRSTIKQDRGSHQVVNYLASRCHT